MFKTIPFLFLQWWSMAILAQTTQNQIVNTPPISLQSITTPIGTTTYDLQTNRGMCRRVAVDGENVYATWTMSQSFDHTAADRGTGFNTSNDNGETWQDSPTERLEENLRTGWSNIGVTESGRIFSIAHIAALEENPTETGLTFSWKDEDADWQTKVIEGDRDAQWARVANDEKAIHVIAARTRNTTGVSGIEGELYYFRSVDEGDTWSEPMALPDLSNYLLGSNVFVDSYAIDVQGDVVAFVMGNERSPTILYKSMNGGEDWEVTVINEAIPFKWGVFSSGQMTVLIDHNDKVHVWYDRHINVIEEFSSRYLPNNTCLMYWNEDMGMNESQVLGLTARMDYDGDEQASIALNETEYRSYGKALVGQPSAGMDAEGNFYVAYSSTRDGAYEIARPDSRLYRDIYLIKSTDGGMTWQGPYNVTNSTTTEDVYPSIQRNVDNFVHLVYQSDALTGVAVNNASGSDIGHDEFVSNTIYHVRIPVEDIQTPEILNNTFPVYMPYNSGFFPRPIEGCIPPFEKFDSYILDFPDGDLADAVEIQPTFDVNVAGDTGVWLLSFSDSDGNMIVDSIMIDLGVELEVIADDTPPIIFPHPFVILQGETLEEAANQFNPDESVFLFPQAYEIDIIVGTDYQEMGVELFDEGQIFGCPPTLEIEGSIDTSTPSNEPFEIKYIATDQAGNQSEWIRKVNVIGADLVAPEILLVFDDPLNPIDGDGQVWEIRMGEEWVEPGYYAYDNVDGDVTDKVVIGGHTVNTSEMGDYTVTYNIHDAAGNVNGITRIVRVKDGVGPELLIIGPSLQNVPCNSIYTESGANAFDAIDGFISDQIEIRYYDSDGVEIPNICTCCPGLYTVVYTVMDSDGNVSEEERTVIVQNNCELDCCDNIMDACYVSIEEQILQSNITLYPNPTSNHFFIDFKDLAYLQSNARIEVYDVMGKLVQNVETFSSNGNSILKVDIQQAIAGVYWVKIQTEERVVSRKVVIR